MKTTAIAFIKRESNTLASAKPGEFYRIGPALYLVVVGVSLTKFNLVNIADGTHLGNYESPEELAAITPLPVFGPLTVSITAVEE